jgi:hypothetical protein
MIIARNRWILLAFSLLLAVQAACEITINPNPVAQQDPQDPFLPETPQDITPNTDEPPTPEIVNLQTQIGTYLIINLVYPPTKWDPQLWIEASKSGNNVNVYQLQHKYFGCNIHDNLGFGPPETWSFASAEKTIGNLLYKVETWTDTGTGNPVLIIYQFPPDTYDSAVRIEIRVDDHPSECLADAEEVIRFSETEILNR